MAAPIMHIVLAIKVLALLPATIDKAAFIVGTSFPDIRYRAHIDRDVTHIEPVSWKMVAEEQNSFRAGMLFHNLVDILRIHYFEPLFYDRYSLEQYTPIYSKLFPLLMKEAEDVFLYPMLADTQWQEIISYFDATYDEEKAMCADEACIKSWHILLQNYFKQPPSLESINALLQSNDAKKFWSCKDNFDAIAVFNALLANSDFENNIVHFYTMFEQLLSDELLTMPSIDPKILSLTAAIA